MPPKYKKDDFLRTSYWNQRGKLDVPKERFISYPLASPDGDDSLLLGWAGWDHREQAHALMTLIEERSTTDGWDAEKLMPLIAGLAEVHAVGAAVAWRGRSRLRGEPRAMPTTTYLKTSERSTVLPRTTCAPGRRRLRPGRGRAGAERPATAGQHRPAPTRGHRWHRCHDS